MQLKARVDDCMIRMCDPMKARAEAIAKRLGLDENKKGPPAAKDFIENPNELIANKTWTMSEVIEYHGFEDCFSQCQKPVRMFQMMIKQNVLAIGRNQKACMESCRDLKEADYYECNSKCMDNSTKTISLLDKSVSDDIIMCEEKIFGDSKF